MSDAAVKRVMVAAVVVNLVLILVLTRASRPEETHAASPPPSPSPSNMASSAPPPPLPPNGVSNAAPAPPTAAGVPSGPATAITLEELYWGITRYEDERSLHPQEDDAQMTAVLAVLRQARDANWPPPREAEALMKAMPQGMRSQIAFWHGKAAEWPVAAQHAMVATRDDAIDVLEHPPAADSRTASRGNADKAPRLTVGFDFVLWGLLGLEKSDMPLSKEQARFVSQVLDALPEHQQKLDACSSRLYEVAEQVLTEPQKQYIASHREPIESYSLRYQTAVPLDSDVIGYICLRLLAHRAGVGFRKIEVPPFPPVDPQVAQNHIKADEFSAGVLLLENDDQLKVTPEQARAMMGYVKGICEYNFAWHMGKEQIGDMLTKKQRIWIMDKFEHGQLGDGSLTDMYSVANQFRDKAAGQ